jgi:hypothetical protein
MLGLLPLLLLSTFIAYLVVSRRHVGCARHIFLVTLVEQFGGLDA